MLNSWTIKISGLLSVAFLLMISCQTFGQNVINPKGTRVALDTSKWKATSNDIHFKNTGNVGIGINPPLYKLDVSAPLNPLRLTGLQSGSATDSIITEAAGVIRRVSMARLITDTSIYKYDGSLTGNRTFTLNGSTFSIATGGTAFNITGLPNGAGSDSVLTIDNVGLVRRASMARLTTDTSIYKYDGSLTGNRTLAMVANNLTFLASTGNLLYLPIGSGRVGIGTVTPNASALVDISSTTRGVLVPSMTSAQRIAISSPANGLLVYDNTTNCFWVFKGSLWVQLVSGAPTINTQSGTTYTLLASDNGSVLEFTSTSPVTLTVPSGLPSGFQCSITQLGTGIVTVVGSGGLVVRNPYNYTKTAAQYSKIGIEIPSTANTAILSGDAM